MSHTPPAASRARTIAYMVFMLAVAFYGLLALQTGQHNLPAWNDPSRAADIASARAKGDADVAVEALSATETRAYPAWVNLMGRVSSSRYTYGSDGISDIGQYYATMPAAQKTILSTHMALGGICIILGLFQFWPAFRKRQRRAHRLMGAAYVVAALAAMTLSSLHLLHAGVANTYQGFVFYVGLWLMVAGVVGSVLAAGYFIWRRDIALHLGWQAVGFGFLLTAPVQRYDWMLLGHFFPGLSQGTANGVVNVALFWQCLLLGYLLFAWNRAESARRAAPQPVLAGPADRIVRAVVAGVAALAAVGTLLHYGLAPGLAQWPAAQGLVPASLMAADSALFTGVLPGLFALALVVTIGGALWLALLNADAARVRIATYAGALIAGSIQMTWGWQLGGPSTATFSGGTFYLLSGFSLTGFALLAAGAQARGRDGLRQEWTGFVLAFALAPMLLLWQLSSLRWSGLVPVEYALRGHAYMLAGAGALMLSLLGGFVAAMRGRETATRVIN